jgi:DNA-binding MarR family transcriptional regulator
VAEVQIRRSETDLAELGNDEPIGEIESALHGLTQALKQARLTEYLLGKARVDVDRAGFALLYALYLENTSLRLTDLAVRLQIEAPAVTRKAQQLERSGLVSRTRDQDDGRATLLQLTKEGHRTIARILDVRREWLNTLLSDWPEAKQIEFARLVRLFTESVNQHLQGVGAQ